MTLKQYREIIDDYKADVINRYYSGLINEERTAYLIGKLDAWFANSKRNGSR
ncbi:hypothetical protein [Terribacillus saccharophilus]|uniref:hypothetical protein n=1 Tax=Terribacillus saccharophilus TaxID=361277 RepID=UPI003D2A2D83